MEIIIERVCGMDVHKNNITACVMTPEGKDFRGVSSKGMLHTISNVEMILKN
ncbi:IS110 family transposase [Peribacillus sp. Bi134]|uniref:IS110 family transposase n=1 Tax=Peribacillus TaxID=2675229 RepID=UPI001E579F61|nr:IS110 family transposase [Peribacillus sp. Bi134]